MKIAALSAREIFDSRGIPTLESILILEDGTVITAGVPTGRSRGSYESIELRDGGDRLFGFGVLNAIEKIEKIIAPALVGKRPDVVNMDMTMLELDNTLNKSNLGANTILAVSMAVCKAQAHVDNLEIYELIAHLCGFETISLPSPLFNLINGGAHAHNKLRIQEFMVMPIGVNSFRLSIEIGSIINQTIVNLLIAENKFFGRGDEGGYSVDFKDDSQALDLLMRASEQVAQVSGATIMLALDAAANQWYDARTGTYKLQEKLVTNDELIAWYENLCARYPIYSLEDGLAADDWDGWKKLAARLDGKVQLIGDDLFATHPERVWQSIESQLMAGVIIKPNQIGTITETLQVAKLCKEHNRSIIVSHRSGETNDSFIADLAVGISANYLKAGGLSNGERMAKYNRLLMIEEELLLSC